VISGDAAKDSPQSYEITSASGTGFAATPGSLRVVSHIKSLPRPVRTLSSGSYLQRNPQTVP